MTRPPQLAPQLGRPVGANGEETRRRIITSAMRCVAEVGISQTTIREIARVAEMTSGSLYHYFPNKSELLRATGDQIEEIVGPRLRAAVGQSGDIADQIDAVLDESQRLLRDFPYLIGFLRAVRSGGPVQSRQDVPLYPGSEALRAVVTEVIETAHAQGAISPELAPVDAINVICALTRGLTGPAANTPPEAYEATLRSAKRMIRGTLFARPAPSPST